MKTRPKCLIIGWDGATYDIIMPLVENGTLPNLKKLIAKGTHGIMNSMVPPFTAMAWSSFATGLNPGKHGLFSFWGRYIPDFNEKGYRRKDLNSKHLDGKTLWSHLSKYDRRVGVVNFPMSYPAEEVNGILIGGMLCPSMNSSLVYPRESYEELLKVSPEYRIDVDFNIIRTGDIDGHIKHVEKMLDQRIKAVLHYWEKEKWDLFTAVFTECDRLQHVFWHSIDSKHIAFNKDIHQRWGKVISNAYKKLDDALGYMLDTTDPETTVMVLSDHGFGAANYRVHLNLLLKEMGLLCTKHVGLDGRQIEVIDWAHTRAYAGHTYEHCIFINLRGRDHFGIVSPGKEYRNLLKYLSEAISQIKDPVTDKYIVKNVLKADDIYWGEHTFYAPDLVYETVEGSYLHSDTLSPKKIVEPVTWHTGSHRKEGIYVLAGPGVRQGWSDPGDLYDVFPTICSIMGVPSLPMLDGVVMEQCFEPAYFKMINDLRDSREEIASVRDTECIENRLRGIGYFD